MKSNSYITIASFSGAIAVVLGALGAHALKKVLSPDLLDSFLTGNRYHLFHSILLLIIGILMNHNKSKLVPLAGKLIMGGIVLFSFSIYILATRNLWTSMNLSWLGPITPLGGILLISGWILLGISFTQNSTKS